MEKFNWVTVMTALFGSFFGWFLGGFDKLLIALLIFVIIDYVTGVLVSVIQKNISSKIGFKGICKKIFIFVLVGIANIIDTSILGTGEMVRGAVILFYCSNELISILENVSKTGLPIPDYLKTVVNNLRRESNKKVNKR